MRKLLAYFVASALAVLALLPIAPAAWATTCSSPSGNAGDLMYSSDFHVPQYCNGTTWIPAGPLGLGGAGCSTAPTGLIHYWALNEAPGATTAVDATNAKNATLAGSATFTTSGKFGNALSLPNVAGSKASVTTPADMLSQSHLTLGFWAKRGASLGTLQVGQQNGSGFNSIGIELSSDGNAYFEADPPGGAANFYGYVAFNDTNWHYYTMVYDGTLSGNARIAGYIDGVAQSLAYTGTSAATTTATALTFYIGNMEGTENDNGTIDELRVYNTALTAAQVGQLASGMLSTSEGDILYNYSSHVLQYCDGTGWRPMGPLSGGGGG